MRRYTQYLEYVSGRSAKFWQVTVIGEKCSFRWGRIGTDGQTMTKTLPTEGLAYDVAIQKVDEKLQKGYRPRGKADQLPPRSPEDLEVEIIRRVVLLPKKPAKQPAVRKAQPDPTAPRKRLIDLD